MGWELHIQRPSEDGDCLELGPPLGTMEEVRAALEDYFPGTYWESAGRAECSNDHGYIAFTFCGEPVEWINVSVADAIDDGLPLTLIGMAREKGWIIVNDGSGDPLDNEYPKAERAIQKIQRGVAKTRATPPKRHPKSKLRLPRVTSVTCLADVKVAREHLSLATMCDDETSHSIYANILPTLFPDDDCSDVTWHPILLQNEEIQLPDGRRLAVLRFLSSDEIAEGQCHMGSYYEKTSRTTATWLGEFVVLADGSKFRSDDCTLVTRVLGRPSRL